MTDEKAEEPPLLSYAALLGLFNLLLGAALVLARRTGAPAARAGRGG